MEIDFLTDDSEKSLAPFYFPRILFAAYSVVFIAGSISLLIWPREAAVRMVASNSVPKHFFIMAM